MNFTQRMAFMLFAAALIPPSAGRAAETQASEDGEVVGVLGAANQGEIDAADLALKKARAEDVRKFAAHMKADHDETKQKLAALGISPKASVRAAALKSQAAEEAVRLKLSTAEKFDSVYMDAQINDHQGLLKALDEDLIAKSQALALTDLLRKVRGTVAIHLEEARRVQAGLPKAR